MDNRLVVNGNICQTVKTKELDLPGKHGGSFPRYDCGEALIFWREDYNIRWGL